MVSPAADLYSAGVTMKEQCDHLRETTRVLMRMLGTKGDLPSECFEVSD